ncbi:MAG: DMT family transporter [Ilumatobacteraceae bacterium]
MTSSHRGTACSLAAAAVSGVAVFVNGLAVRRFADATVYTTAKNLVAGAVLAAVLLVTMWRAPARALRMRGAARSHWAVLGLIAAIGGAVPFVLFFEGLARATSTNASFVHKTLVVWVAIGASIVLRERVGSVHVAAIGLLLIGHLVLSGGLGAAAFGSAELLVLAATLLWSVEVLVVKRMLPEVPPELAATARMVGGSALLVAWLGVQGDLGGLTSLDGTQWLWVLLTGATLAVFVGTWYTALSLAPAVDVTAVLVLGAVITGLLDAGFRGVPLTVDSSGYVLIALGVAAIAMRRVDTRPTGQRLTA